MTRDEAIRAFEGISTPASFSTEAFIERFVALGMLKLDGEPPKGPNERAVDALFEGSLGGMITPRQAIRVIEAAGLKIVEAK